MIPKIIHYCWFGRGTMPELAKKCIASWKKYLPEYEIKEWNEDNFNIDSYPYVREAYDSRKYAFVTDVVRLHALYTEGGIYMDTDVEVLKPLDTILDYEGVSGFETDEDIPTGLMASEKGHPLVKEWLEDYDGLHFIKEDRSQDVTTNVVRMTRICKKYGFIGNNKIQTIKDFTFLPKDFLCPKSYETGKIELSDNTLTIHHFAGSWLSPACQLSIKKYAKLHYIPHRYRGHIANLLANWELYGFSSMLKYEIIWIKKKLYK